MSKNKKEIKDIWIDGDHLLYKVAMSNRYKDDLGECEGDDFGVVVKEKKDYSEEKEHLKSLIEDYVITADVESICHGWTTGETYVVFGGKTNFRKKLSSEYKSNRIGIKKPDSFYALQKWARKKYICTDNCEADDVVAYHVRKGGLGFSTDKDILRSQGIWFNCYHTKRFWVYNSRISAFEFLLLQCLAGDSTDNIKGLSNVGIATAKKILDKVGYTWDNVINEYIKRGYTREDAVLTRNLVDMTLWHPKKGVRLIK